MSKQDWPDWEVYKRYRCQCVYCGFNGLDDIKKWRQLQVDHLIPVSLGGPNEMENKVVACTDCNRKKHAFDPSKGDISLLDSKLDRKKLINVAVEHIRQKNLTEEDDFRLMMEEIKK